MDSEAMELGRRFDAYQNFILGCKLYWTREIYGALREAYEARARKADPAPASADDVAALLADDPLAQYFGWFERHLQRCKYSGRHGLQPAHAARRDEIEARLDRKLPDGLLSLDDDFEHPSYFTSVDIHQHPGGIWSDPIGGVVYERGARGTTPLLDRDKDLHDRFSSLARQHISPKRVLDMGCGFGKSTRPFYTECREAEVIGIDIAAPCLKLAAITASGDRARNVRYQQKTAEDTGFEGESFDLVTSTMVLHEMPPPAIEKLIAESYRLLEPGGFAIHLDFLAEDDPFARYVHYGHARRNNEPYMPPLNEMDVLGVHRAAGFRDARIARFEEMPGALAPEFRAWRFPWVAIIAEK